MTISDSDQIRAFADRLARMVDRLELLTEQTTHGLSTVAGAWRDGAFDELDSAIRTSTGSLRAFAETGRDYAVRLQDKADRVDAVAAHRVSSGGTGGRFLDAASGAGVAGGTASPGGSGPGPEGGGRYRPGTQGTVASSPYGDAIAFRTSSNGVAFLKPDDDAVDNASLVSSFGRCFDVMAHGYVNESGDSANRIAVPMKDGSVRAMDARQLAALLRESAGGSVGQPVRLCSCKTGQMRHGFAAQLARELGVPVVAPVQSIWFDSSGRTLWHAPPFASNRATWRVFAPDGRAWEFADGTGTTKSAWRPI